MISTNVFLLLYNLRHISLFYPCVCCVCLAFFIFFFPCRFLCTWSFCFSSCWSSLAVLFLFYFTLQKHFTSIIFFVTVLSNASSPRNLSPSLSLSLVALLQDIIQNKINKVEMLRSRPLASFYFYIFISFFFSSNYWVFLLLD